MSIASFLRGNGIDPQFTAVLLLLERDINKKKERYKKRAQSRSKIKVQNFADAARAITFSKPIIEEDLVGPIQLLNGSRVAGEPYYIVEIPHRAQKKFEGIIKNLKFWLIKVGDTHYLVSWMKKFDKNTLIKILEELNDNIGLDFLVDENNWVFPSLKGVTNKTQLINKLKSFANS